MDYYEDGFGGFEYHEAPNCPWCGSSKTWAEFGMYDACFPGQLSPYQCIDCGSVEFWSADDRSVADEEERRVCWFRPPLFEPPTGIEAPADIWDPMNPEEFAAAQAKRYTPGDTSLFDMACRITPEQIAACSDDKTIEACRDRFDNLGPFSGQSFISE